MPHVLVAGRIHDAGVRLLSHRPDVTFEMLDGPTAADIDARIADIDALLVRVTPVRAALIEKARRLKVISRHGVGYDAIDVPALTARGIPLTVVGDANAVPVAEHTLALMLAVTRQLPAYDRGMRQGGFHDLRDRLGMTELAGKTVLVVGFGRIGTRVARRCSAFDMRVIVADPYIPRRAVEGQGYRYVADFRDALAEADIVTLHLPGNPDGTAIIGTAELRAMKPGAYLINCARGSLVDEAALAASLQDGTLSGAGLDVMAAEPPAPDHPLLRLDNVVLSPHCAPWTAECNIRVAEVAARNVLDALDGRLDPEMVVNQDVLR